MPAIYRPDRDGKHRAQYDKNKKRIYAQQKICGICGQEVDFSYKFPHPLSPCVDHIIPVAKGGHPSDIDNLQLAHFKCNRAKSDTLATTVYKQEESKKKGTISNDDLPLILDWLNYKPQNNV